MRLSRKCLIVSLMVLLSLTVSYVALAQSAEPEKPKGVILFIGDGMGANQLKAAQIYATEILGRDLAINSIKISGNTTTHSASAPITDSAAAATAIYSGFKANNGQLNVLPDGMNAEGIGKAAKNAGMSVGIVSTSRITDATPAAIYAIASNRSEHDAIALQLTEFMPDVVLGVGLKSFMPKDLKSGDRKDGVDLISAMKKKGYEYVTNSMELVNVDTAKVDRLLGMFSSGNMPYALDRKSNPSLSGLPNLAEMTRAAISIVGRNPRGFLLMIEGGRIDHACHANDIRTMIEETIEFDDAVAVALKFQETRPDILVIVTGDHETGGLGSIGSGDFSMDPKAIKSITRSLSSIEEKVALYPDHQDALLRSAGIELNPEEAEQLRLSRLEAEKERSTGKDSPQKSSKYDLKAFLKTLGEITSKRAKVEWKSNGHTELPVITRATGPGACMFEGDYDNTDIALKISELLGLRIPALDRTQKDKTSSISDFRLAA